MSFLMLPLLAGMLAMSIPVIIHLLHRQRTTPLQWGAMQFLLESPLQLKRRKRVDHWLLMLLRMAVVGLLAFLLARPLAIQGQYNPLAGSAGTDIAIVLDRSVSTGRMNGQQTVFQQGVGVVDEVVKLMKPNDTIAVVLAEHRPNTSLTPKFESRADAAATVARLRQMKPGLTDASIPDSVQAARELGGARNTKRMILVVGDDQRGGWKVENNAAWRAALGERVKGDDKQVKMFSVPIIPADTRVSDVSVGELSIQPGIVGVNRPVQVTATLSNSGPEEVGAFNAELVVDGKPIEKRGVASLKPGSTQTIRFDHTFTEAGSRWVKVRTDAADALAADNESVSAAHVWEKLPVLIIDGQLTAAGAFKSSQFLVAAMQPVAEAALEATTLIQPKVVSVSEADALKLEDFPAVVVNDVPAMSPALLDRLFDCARRGNGVWFILGPRTDQSFLVSQLAKSQFLTLDVKEKRNSQKPPAPEIKSPQNPMIQLVAASEKNSMTGAITKQWWSLRPKDGDGQVVLAGESGDPLILERPVGTAGGRVVVWTTSADGSWNNLPLLPNFVPLVNETVYHLAGGATAGLQNRSFEAGGPIEWSAPAVPAVKVARITRPDGKVVERRPSLSNGRQRITYHDTGDPGLYALRFEPAEVQPQPVFYGFGINRKELDTATLSEADQAWLSERGYLERRVSPTSKEELAQAVGGVNKGTDLWPILGLAVLGLLVFETLMTRRMVNLQKKVDVASSGLPTAPASAFA
jgi:hypothetical protein